MILLSALLASLTGLVAGERPAERAQVELSVAAAVVLHDGEAAAASVDRFARARPRLERIASGHAPARLSLPAPAGRALLSLKQSWLH